MRLADVVGRGCIVYPMSEIQRTESILRDEFGLVMSPHLNTDLLLVEGLFLISHKYDWTSMAIHSR